MRNGQHVMVVVCGALAGGLAGCGNSYTCYDYRNCAPEGGTGGDARTDARVHHDGGLDAPSDRHVASDGAATREPMGGAMGRSRRAWRRV
jgi:hypothetical protein